MEVANDISNLRRQFYTTAGLAELKIIPDDKCCRILAYLFVYGGSNEQLIDSRVSDAAFYAQGRLNILGGEKPDAALVPILQDYIKSIKDYKNPPEWVLELEKEYAIKPHRGDWD
jgi:hypothetical protein